METITLRISGMSCEHCVNKVETALQKQEGVKKAKVNLKKGIAKVKYDASVQSSKQLSDIVQEVGYEAEPINNVESEALAYGYKNIKC